MGSWYHLNRWSESHPDDPRFPESGHHAGRRRLASLATTPAPDHAGADKLIENRTIGENERVQLIEGVLVNKIGRNRPHIVARNKGLRMVSGIVGWLGRVRGVSVLGLRGAWIHSNGPGWFLRADDRGVLRSLRFWMRPRRTLSVPLET